jgi:hypothetical protein
LRIINLSKINICEYQSSAFLHQIGTTASILKPIHNVKEEPNAPYHRPKAVNCCLHLWKNALKDRKGHANACHSVNRAGGAYRDRTDDLKLAKLPLSQLS